VTGLGDPHTVDVSKEVAVLHLVTLGVAYFKWN
jgi:hypothetical protein